MIKRIISALTTLISSAATGLAVGFALLLTITLISYARSAPIERSIVKVTNTEATGGGTGWVTRTTSGKRVIVTNNHVCQVSTANYVRIEDDAGNPSMKAILRRDAQHDLCVIEGVDSPTLKLAGGAPKRFDQITVYGHPFLNPTTPSFGQYLADEIGQVGFSPNANGECDAGELADFSGPRQPRTEMIYGIPTSFGGAICAVYMHLSLSTVTIFPGNSGSPVANSSGEVVGVMNSASPADNRGNFIPLEYVKAILED